MFRRALLAAVSLVLVTGLAPSAVARPVAEIEPVARANPQLSRQVIESLPPAVRASNVRIGADITVDTPIIYPDGSLVPGQTAAKRAAARVSCNGPFLFVYLIVARPSRASCGVFGSPGLKMKYTWMGDFGDEGVPLVGCMAAEGHDDVGRVKWIFAGCGHQSGTTVPWGNNLAVPRVLATSGTDGFRGQWSRFSKSSSARCTTRTFPMPPSVTKNAISIKCPNVFTKMRAKGVIGSTTEYGRYVGPNAWSTAVFAPGKKPKTVYAVK